jgi:hypothetical protein
MAVLYQPDYVNLLDGDVQCAVMLSQLVYWYKPGKNGTSRLRVYKPQDGKMWIAKSWQEWQAECGLSRAQSRRCLKKLKTLGFVELKVYRFKGTPTIHVRFPWVPRGNTLVDAPSAAELRQRISAIGSPAPDDSTSHSIPSPAGIQCPAAASPLVTNGHSITDTTPENTTEKGQEKGSKKEASLPTTLEEIGKEKTEVDQGSVEVEETPPALLATGSLQQVEQEAEPSHKNAEGITDTSVSLPPAWMNAGKPMPPKDFLKMTGTGKPKHSAKGHALGMIWQNCLRTQQPDKYHKPLTNAECDMLAYFGDCVEDKAAAVLEFVLAHWVSFVTAATTKYGLFGSQPAEPYVPWFCKYHESAVNLTLQSIAKKKQGEEHKAKETEKAKANTGEPPSSPKVYTELPPRVLFTPEQFAFVFNDDLIESKELEAYIDRVNKRYGCAEFVPGSTNDQKLLVADWEYVSPSSRRKVFVCDVPLCTSGLQ